jgi:hypothetical protein
MFQEMHKILKQDGLLFLDKGHVDDSEVKEIVGNTDLFSIAEDRKREVLLNPNVRS